MTLSIFSRLVAAGIVAIAALAAPSAAAGRPPSPLDNARRGGAGPADGKAVIKWDADTHDFGTFNEDVGSVTHVFTGVNEGPDTAIVTTLRASCGCTTPTTDIKVIAPGDTVRLTVAYDPYNRPGGFDKRIILHALPGIHDEFHIKGTVISSSRRLISKYPHKVGTAFRLNSRNAAFGALRDDRTATANILGVNNTEERVTPTVEGLPGWIEAIIDPLPVEPGTAFAISLTAYGPRVPELGLAVDTLTVASVEHPDMSVRVPASVIVFENLPELSQEEMDQAGFIEASATEVDFGNDIDPRSSKAITRKVTLTNGGLSPVKIRRAYTIIPGFTVKAPDEIGPGKSADLEITLRPDRLRPGTHTIEARIQVIAGTPLNTYTDITARGAIAAADGQ